MCNPSQILSRAALFMALVCLCSCHLFSSDTREIGGGYRLKRDRKTNQFALLTPHESGGLIIDEIGWHAPVIMARATGSQYWDAINTAHAQHTRIRDAARTADPLYQDIPIEGAEKAWTGLNQRGRLW